MYLMIDNYDSFVFNLARYFEELGAEILTVRNDQITPGQIEMLAKRRHLEGLILSPGPKTPSDCGFCKEIVSAFTGKIPILGVCLGHQIIGEVFGAKIEKGNRPMHGKVTQIHHSGNGLFAGLPSSYEVTRYHSLQVCAEDFPDTLQIDARTEDGVIMAIRHKTQPVYGVQFHPEAVLTQYGHELLSNYIKICKRWKKNV
ncbi:MAG: anthranilate synthase component II [Lachnospiraceae bacterium]